MSYHLVVFPPSQILLALPVSSMPVLLALLCYTDMGLFKSNGAVVQQLVVSAGCRVCHPPPWCTSLLPKYHAPCQRGCMTTQHSDGREKSCGESLLSKFPLMDSTSSIPVCRLPYYAHPGSAPSPQPWARSLAAPQ